MIEDILRALLQAAQELHDISQLASAHHLQTEKLHGYQRLTKMLERLHAINTEMRGDLEMQLHGWRTADWSERRPIPIKNPPGRTNQPSKAQNFHLSRPAACKTPSSRPSNRPAPSRPAAIADQDITALPAVHGIEDVPSDQAAIFMQKLADGIYLNLDQAAWLLHTHPVTLQRAVKHGAYQSEYQATVLRLQDQLLFAADDIRRAVAIIRADIRKASSRQEYLDHIPDCITFIPKQDEEQTLKYLDRGIYLSLQAAASRLNINPRRLLHQVRLGHHTVMVFKGHFIFAASYLQSLQAKAQP